MVASSAGESLQLRRVYEAAPRAVYAAWADPEVLDRWFVPRADYVHSVVEADVRVGGRFRIGFRSPEGSVNVVSGRYVEVRPAERLVFTWTWESPNDFAGEETLVTVEFLPHPAGTELVLTHERFPQSVMRELHEVGWSGCLEMLEAVL